MPDQAALFSLAPPPRSTPPEPQGAMPRYEKYHPSDLAWLGDIPAHWRTKPLRFACRLNPTKGEVSHLPGDTEVSFVPMEAVHEFGGMDLEQTRLIGDVLQGYTYFRDGDVVAAKITPCFENGKGSIADGLTNGLGFGTTELHTLRPGPEFDTRFLFYVTLSHEFRHQGAGHMYGAGGQKRVPEAFLQDFAAPMPPIPEQEAIAGWLDERTRRIDELVVAKRRLIALLAEQRTALITHAVTNGLNPRAPMKPSGIDWLGDVPGHWEVKRLRFSLRSIEQGWSPQCDSRQVEGDTEWGVLKVGCVNGTTFDESENKALPADLDPLPEYEIKPGDVLMSRANTRELLGSAAYVHAVRPRLHLCDKLYRIRTNARQIDPRFLVLSFRAHACRFQFEREADGASGSMKNIGQDTIKNVWMLLPPLEEQHAIVAHLDAASAKLDALTAAAETAIARLTEYRQALISAAVTGKIRVCEQGSVSDCESGGCGTATIIDHAAGRRRGANKHFQRTVLAAQIIATIGGKPTFGRVKLQKAMVLAEYHLHLDEIKSEPVRAAAGPFDNQMMQSVHAQLKRSQWYDYDQSQRGGKYKALAKAGGHAQYFDRYWSVQRPGFDALMKTLDPMTTEQAEIVATLYAAWNDFLIDRTAVTDDALVAEVMNNWHPDKDKITEQQWRAAVPWMRQHGLVPTGYGAHTRVASHDGSKE